MSQILVDEKPKTQQMMEERYHLLIDAKWEDKDELIGALEEQKRIRERFSEKCRGWNSTETIRTWREAK